MPKIECPQCGTKNHADSKFCKSCGTKLGKELSKTKEASSKKMEKLNKDESDTKTSLKIKPLYIGVIAVIIIIAVLGILYIHTSNNNTSKVYSSNTTKPECTTSSQCSAGDYCSSYGACLRAYCGDGVCTAQERANNSCAIDCGCGSGQVLNKYTNQCQSPINVSTETITTYIDSYLSQNNVTGHITSINNTYYGNYSVKEAVVDCQTNTTSYPCQIIFYFNQTGNVINVIRTS
jgi:hypothetical protein